MEQCGLGEDTMAKAKEQVAKYGCKKIIQKTKSILLCLNAILRGILQKYNIEESNLIIIIIIHYFRTSNSKFMYISLSF